MYGTIVRDLKWDTRSSDDGSCRDGTGAFGVGCLHFDVGLRV